MRERLQQLALVQSSDGQDALEWLVKTEQQTRVNQALQQLRPQEREILILKYTENWTYQQLADHLGASTNTIEYRLIRAKKQLRKLLCQAT